MSYGHYVIPLIPNKVMVIQFMSWCSTEVLFFTEFVQPVCLPPEGQNFTAGRKCFIAGWGRDTDGVTHKLHTNINTKPIKTHAQPLSVSHLLYLCQVLYLTSSRRLRFLWCLRICVRVGYLNTPSRPACFVQDTLREGWTHVR